MKKSVQIDLDLFFDLYDMCMEHGSSELRGAMQDKLDRMIDHAYFTLYKRAPQGSKEREEARKKYLDHKGVLPGFRSESETI